MLIARTREKESMAEDGVFWWREYRLRKDKSEGLWLVEMRYMSRIGDKIYARIDGKTDMLTDPNTTWRRWTSGNTPSEAIRDVMGDTAFFNAESLSPLHAKAVEESRRRREQTARIENAKKNLGEAQRSLEEWKTEQNRLFHKRHGDKTGEAYQKAFDRTKKRLQPEYDRLAAEVTKAKNALQEIICGNAQSV